MIAEAIDTAITLGWALLAWVAVLAAVASIILLAGTAAGLWAGQLLWRRVVRPAWARGPVRAWLFARSRARRRPPWVHSQPVDYEEAA